MSQENIKVAVRVRPPASKSENGPCVNVSEKTVILTDEDNDGAEKQFTFDYAYWSYDGYRKNQAGYFEPSDDKYADQSKLFKDLGIFLLDNAFQSYNSTLFAYGQTNSGKTYSTFGSHTNPGIIPMIVSDLFQRIKHNSTKNLKYRETISMLEVYREKLRDLLVEQQPSGVNRIRVWHSPSYGYYVKNLSEQPATSEEEVLSWMLSGAQKRTIAETNQNKRSSRAHTLYTLKLTRVEKGAFVEKGKKVDREVTCKINVVDLAGSERVGESYGQVSEKRSREGANINLSLMYLKRVINSLAKKVTSKHPEKVKVEFGQSVLTKILKDGLGGNSRTVMLSAISAAPENYRDTLSTLNFAADVKSIRTEAVKNEDPREVMLKKLEQENQLLLKELERYKKEGIPNSPGTLRKSTVEFVEEEKRILKEEMMAMSERLEENEKLRQQLAQTGEDFKKRYSEAQKELKIREKELKTAEEEKASVPHLLNLNEDDSLSRMLCVMLRSGRTVIGRNPVATEKALRVEKVSGSGVESTHAIITNKNGKLQIESVNGSQLSVSGDELQGNGDTMDLHNNDFLVFGGSSVYVVVVPGEETSGEPISWFDAQAKLAEAQGYGGDTLNAKLQSVIVELLPLVSEANYMSAMLDRRIHFRVDTKTKVSASTHGRSLESEAVVEVEHLDQDLVYIWSAEKFMDRLFEMRDFVERWEEEEIKDISTVPLDEDPFWDRWNDQLVGSTVLFLKDLCYGFEIDLGETGAPIVLGQSNAGYLQASLLPCDCDGNQKSIDDECFDDPDTLCGNSMSILLKIDSAKGLPKEYKSGGMWCQYKFYNGEEFRTKIVQDTSSPVFDYSRIITIDPVSRSFLSYLDSSVLIIEVWGRTGEAPPTLRKNASTKNLLAVKKKKHSTVISEEKLEAQKLSLRVEDLEDRNRALIETTDRLSTVITAIQDALEFHKASPESAVHHIESLLKDSEGVVSPGPRRRLKREQTSRAFFQPLGALLNTP